MNIRIRQDFGAFAFALAAIAATYVALVPAKIGGKGAYWPFVVGLVLVLLILPLWRLVNAVSSNRTTVFAGSVIALGLMIAAAAVAYVIAVNVKDFSMSQFYWGALSGAILLVGYFVHYGVCERAGFEDEEQVDPASAVSSYGPGQHPLSGTNPTN